MNAVQSRTDGVRTLREDGLVTVEVKVMPWLQIVVSLIFAGFLLFLINSYIPLARSVRSILNAVVIIVIVVWLINTFGIMESIRPLYSWLL